MMPAWTIRPATSADLASAHAIWYATEIEGEANPPPPSDFSWLRHVLATGRLLVAERAGDLGGFAGLIARGPLSFLTDVFVRPDAQSSGAGQALLAAILPHDGSLTATMASTDPRALALYIRAGMRPQWPCIWLRADSRALREAPTDGVIAVEASIDDPDLARWDAEISGRERPQDLAYWVRECAATPLWLRRGDQRVGYAFVQGRSDEALWNPLAATIGPVGARAAADAAACVAATITWAQPRVDAMRLSVPGPHPALAPLLDTGWRITYVETALATAPLTLLDMARYLPSGSTFF